MGKVISITNQKGGVGKTTTSINLAHALHMRGRSVLVCDLDPQGNCTSGMGIDKTVTPNVYDMLINNVPATDLVIKTDYSDVLPANRNLSGAIIELVGLEQREFVLKNALATLKGAYEYVLIDCPPSLELLTLNSLVASDSVMIPLQCEYYAMEGLSDLLNTVRMLKKKLNKNLEIEGLVLTMYDSRTKLSEQVADEVRKHFGDSVYKTTIPRNVRLSEAPSHGKPALAYDRISKGSRAYLKLASEFLKRQNNTSN